ENVIMSEFQPEPVRDRGTRFWHVCILVRDMDRMHDFYTNVLGFTQSTDLHLADPETVSMRAQMMALPGFDGLTGIEGTNVKVRHYSLPDAENHLEVLYFPDRPAEQVERHLDRPLGWNHMGLEVTDLDAVIDRIEQHSEATLMGKPSVLLGGHRYLLIKDPEGNVVELYQPAAA
ncbi:MAG: VOC family protein, partial [Gammaproteobacteria bacterium]